MFFAFFPLVIKLGVTRSGIYAENINYAGDIWFFRLFRRRNFRADAANGSAD